MVKVKGVKIKKCELRVHIKCMTSDQGTRTMSEEPGNGVITGCFL